MRLFLLVTLTMTAFAANSILNRMAVGGALIGALPFAAIRLASGATALSLLAILQRGRLPLRAPGRATGVLSLTLYMLGFSLAYLGIDAGTGALILFGAVQVTMFAGAVLRGQEIARPRWIGAAMAFGGLAWLLWPAGAGAPPPLSGALMAAAGLGWGIYSLAGQRAGPPLQATAANFLLATPLALVPALIWGAADETAITAGGVALALLSGVVTSGLGYALWYRVLPEMQASAAALAQLSVPVIAMAGGIALLGEVLSFRFLLAALLVLGGIAFGILAPQRTSSSSGS